LGSSAWRLRFAPREEGDKPGMAGRHWEIKKDYKWLRVIVYAVVGMAILTAVMFFVGYTHK
jgi:hypothetical protein